MNLRSRTLRGLAAMGVVLVALVVAACGSSAKSGGSASATGTDASAASVSHATVSLSGGHLVAANGHAIYRWAADTRNKSHCSSSCLAVWPAVTASGRPTAGSGVKASLLGTIKTDGRTQVTYAGHPLYTFVEDKGAGTTAGQGSDSFGAKWWLVSGSGSSLSGSASAGTTSTTSSTSAGSTGSGSAGGSSWG